MTDHTTSRPPTIQVAFLPTIVPSFRGHTVALIDVIRTSTTVVECFAQGARGVYLSPSSDADWSQHHIEAPMILAELRGGSAKPGATLAPSPSLLKQHPPAGRNVVICTVNGATAAEHLLRSGAFPVLLVGLVNLEASVQQLLVTAGNRTITLVCAGYGGNAHVALDDVYVAGLVVARVLDRTRQWRLTDSARIAMRLAQSYQDPIDALRTSDTAEMLNAIGRSDDVTLCASVDTSPIVPYIVPPGTMGRHAVQVLASDGTTPPQRLPM